MQFFDLKRANEQECEYVNDQIITYNSSQVPFTQSEPFIRLDYIVNTNENIIAGITSVLYCWSCLYIDVLWVSDQYRRQGLGKKLLKKVEEEALKLGCHLSHLDTFDFQAKDFYIKNGYELFGKLDECPPGHVRYFLKKVL